MSGMEVKGAQGKYWCFTNYNLDITYDEWNKMTYLCYGEEICPKTKKIHHQGYVEFSSNMRLSALKKIDKTIHWELRRGTQEDAINYCKKDGKFVEIRERKVNNQGKRNDLTKIKDDILNGKSVDTICIEDPMLFHQYGRTLSKIEDLRLRQQYRTEMTKGIWYVGETGIGKSHIAFKNYNPKTHYTYPNDNGYWDGYTQQDTVIINEFRGGIPYHELLSLVDKWPHNVKRRYREPMPFTSKTVIITSKLRPEEVYNNLSQNDTLDQLYRRFEIIDLNYERDGMEEVRGNTDPDPDTNLPKDGESMLS